ncbi:MAG: gentisate 1,2-dioxygenase [Bryobacteraceae bacterium]
MTGTEFYVKPETTPAMAEYYSRLAKLNAGPLWEVLADLVPKEPKTRVLPNIWRFEEMRPMILEAGALISEKDAERRVLILENPGIKGSSCITETLYAGMQLVLPGETAPTHRHTASALRFVLESKGGYTAVDGERTTMHKGDFIVTPSWTYHDHGNTSGAPVIWLDVLDAPMVNILQTGFAEHHPQHIQPVTKPDGDAQARYGSNMLPVDYELHRRATPLFNYPYSRSRETLDQLYKNGPVHPSHGVKIRFINPATGGAPMPMIQTFMQYLPKGFRGEAYRGTDATIYCVVEGTGQSVIGGTTVRWKENDVFVVPSWHPVSHQPDGEAILFSASDRPIQQAFGLWREQVPAVV